MAICVILLLIMAQSEVLTGKGALLQWMLDAVDPGLCDKLLAVKREELFCMGWQLCFRPSSCNK